MCRVVGQHHSTQRRPKAPTTAAEERLREHLRDFARCHRRLGWRKGHAVARREGLVTNPRRTRRLWRDEGLQRPPQRRAKRRRLTDGTAARLRASCPNDVWALDFQFDETADLRRIKLLNVVDEFTREALAIEAAHSIDSDAVVGTVERLITRRGAPTHLRMDNGPELTAAAPRDWCRIWGTHTAYIEPGSRWETPTWSPSTDACETSASTSRTSPTSPKPKPRSRTGALEYNHYRPHQSLGGLTPTAYAAHWNTHQHQPTHP